MKLPFSLGACMAVVAMALPQAQQREGCVYEGATLRRQELPEGGYRSDIGGGVEATCGTKWLRADSVTWYEERGIAYLYGDVRYRDEGRSMNSERATYYQLEDWVRCEGNVVVTDEVGRSKLTAPLLDYYPLNASRPSERIVAHYRPHLTFHADSAGSADPQPFEVDAERIHIYGDSLVAAQGEVVATRGDLVAFADSMDLNLPRGHIWLLGEDPRVETSAALLQGDSILVLMAENRLREIQAWPNASAQGDNLQLEAPMLRLFIDSDQVIARAVASAGDTARTGAIDTAARDPWARSVSADYALTADSIDIQRPGGRLERVIAVGRAKANTLAPIEPGDSVAGNDWLLGDTITGHFAALDSTLNREQNAELERLVAAGNARALYHVLQAGQQTAGGLPAVNYVIGNLVTLLLVNGEVEEAQVIGPGTGVYLEPLPTPPATDSSTIPPDTTGVITDTLTVDRQRRGAR